MLKQKIKNIPAHIWILVAITFLGLFLQSYKLHDWLDFGNDQVNDAQLVGKVIRGEAPWPRLGPDMSDSGKGGRENRFHIGPMYYYFQIISGKIFGAEPDKFAYPDLFFSVLSIPLFFIFLRKYFSIYISLVLSGLYSFSFYFLDSSHSAWNPHLIPFFTLLFLLAIHKILARERNSQIWPVILGISFGIIIQLHAILLILMPAVLFLAFAYLAIKRQPFVANGILIVIIAIILNLGQIQSEIKNNFKNSEIFYKSAVGTQKSKDNLAIKFIKNIDCHIEANAYILTSIGDKNCDFLSVSSAKKNITNFLYFKILAALLFSASGYMLLFKLWKKEIDQGKKIFLEIVAAYVLTAFIIMIPIIEAPTRYFTHLFFVPYIFLGFMANWAKNKVSAKNFLLILIFVVGIILIFNAISIYPIVQELKNKTRSSREAIILGEIETMAQFIALKSDPQKEAYLLNSNKYTNFFNPIMYVLERKGFDLMRLKKDDKIKENLPIFYLTQHLESSPSDKDGRKVISTHKFGNVDIYEFEK